MPVRYPPNNTRYPGGRDPRGVSYVEPEVGRGRRVFRRLFSAPVIIPIAFLSAIVLGILIYYWTVFSARIDNLLQGEVFTRSAGIYAAPQQLRVSETITQDELITFLKRAAYVEKGQQGDFNRGRYSISGNSVEIETTAVCGNGRSLRCCLRGLRRKRPRRLRSHYSVGSTRERDRSLRQRSEWRPKMLHRRRWRS